MAVADLESAWERYAPWQGTYRTPLRQLGRGSRVRRIVAVVLAGLLVLVTVSLVVRIIVALVRWDLLELLDVIITPVNVFLLVGLAYWRWPPQTRLDRSGVSVRSEPLRTRTVTWEEVVEVQPPGRFDEHPVAVLAGGGRLPLVGMPVAVGEQMAAVTRPAPSSPTSTAAARVSGQEGLDGPFRRGHSAR